MADLTDRSQDVSIHDQVTNSYVTTSVDGSKVRLDVSSKEQPSTNYQLKTGVGIAGTSVSTTDVTLYTFSGAGVIDYIGVVDATSSSYEVAINIDGTERFRLTMSDIGTTLGLTSGDTPLWAATANKQFNYRPAQIGFTTSFSVVARATSGTRTLYHIVLFRQQVV